ncbi:MAG: DEAD/DEAH box helicase [Clostridia bacterium]|nr:DEAD/DEAH box helicase [Clostridia bacterium]
MHEEKQGKDVLNQEAAERLPAYLQNTPCGGHVYGTLSYNRRSKCWTIKGEPCVTEMAKRLFPGSARKRGEARFTANRRIIGDVNWLMMRYPLEVAPRDRALWEKALDQAREHALMRERALRYPQRSMPPEGSFAGTLKEFQKEGLSFLLANPRTLLADEMGLGKTVQALACMAATGDFPVMVIVPPHLVRNWEAEIKRFLRTNGREPSICIIKGLKPYELPKADIYIIHYLLLRGWKEQLPNLGFRMVVFDEIQELRHAGTEKYSAASLLAESCERVIGLSGTPIYNRGAEIWNVINILDFHCLGDWESFTREWCDGYGNHIVRDPGLLGEHLKREGLILRRTKHEVLKELPPKRRLVQEIDSDDRVYRELMKPVIEMLGSLRELHPDAKERVLLEERISAGERQATGVAKAPFVAAFVRALLDSGEHVLLFAHHHAAMDIYRKELSSYEPVFITGRETTAQKERAVELFMASERNLCVISLRAASGLNLQRASCVVFGELDWSPAVHSQAEDRAHRMGQEDSILCYYLVAPQGSDRDMQDALGLKVSQFVQLMGDKTPDMLDAQQSARAARMHIERMLKENEKK